MAMLEVEDIHTYYGEAYVLQGLSLTLEQGQILGLLGRNGVGKTTLVNSIVGFNPPRRGRIVFKGEPITAVSSFETVRREGFARTVELEAALNSYGLDDVTVENSGRTAKETAQELLTALAW